MDVREKLVELIESARYWGSNTSEEIAGTLLENGVTVQDNTEISDELLERLRKAPVTVMTEEPTVEVVQEWISVKDRLPEICDKEPDWSVTVLFRTIQGHIHSGYRNIGRSQKSFYDDDWTPPYWLDESENLTFEEDEVTHWMPLPQPPKGE